MEKSKIEQVIGKYLNLEKDGDDALQSRCPFHQDKNKKTKPLKVWPARGLFACQGCQMTGDVFFFVSQYEQISPEEARKLIQKDYP